MIDKDYRKEEEFISMGQWMIGIDPNDCERQDIDHIKRKTAELIDYIREHGKDGRSTSMAVSFYEQAAEKAVKSVTKPDLPDHLK